MEALPSRPILQAESIRKGVDEAHAFQHLAVAEALAEDDSDLFEVSGSPVERRNKPGRGRGCNAQLRARSGGWS